MDCLDYYTRSLSTSIYQFDIYRKVTIDAPLDQALDREFYLNKFLF